ncbi:MAG: UDP-3-O-(3-hydroxymyristoyl)glucosamine N-acyltransferase [Xanthomonadales bacterium]|nr:UDP-3-O-(3-hydroxymyristoyl)glucosamine N-acyltransferase [Xanthomonadales bacterium]NIN59295.1 UDP-3-O-(3-hydroxymyristoyl)glucosamine N-acyltransferase [Xanthomonadales bacterium]NIN74657.1 UDP-3-O-(3-hydroxymyristoyl)glucosamine N-acyltransferase [Xanthomonadales bacterium]NIO13323.1 UDP-3-O-(3-hydroxymyristoyl)glucosamine N-acyltransferase [Xanthomonadales bacterium]NIP11688.1 UDP-3-O-(3-hydroxymyristoyl)glucosamine N-acyltransferase [Xanthomonadales bacterium]
MKEVSPAYTLAELCTRFGMELRGDGERVISGVGTLHAAGSDQITFLANRSYRDQLPGTRAGAVILAPEDAAACPVDSLVTDDPYLGFARIAHLFTPPAAAEPGIHPSAVVEASAQLGPDVHVGAQAVIGPACRLGDGVSIGPGCVIGPGCTIGAGSTLKANVTILGGATLGRRVIVHPGAVIGADGFGLAFAGERWEKVPQLGSVVVGDDCEIGANTTIDRGAIDDTVLEEDVRIDNLVQVGHNVFIGAHTAIAGCVGIAGSARIGRNCLLAGGSGVMGHIEIADGTTVSVTSVVKKSIDRPGGTWASYLAARPLREWQRILTRIHQLDRLFARVRQLESDIRKLEDND